MEMFGLQQILLASPAYCSGQDDSERVESEVWKKLKVEAYSLAGQAERVHRTARQKPDSALWDVYGDLMDRLVAKLKLMWVIIPELQQEIMDALGEYWMLVDLKARIDP